MGCLGGRTWGGQNPCSETCSLEGPQPAQAPRLRHGVHGSERGLDRGLPGPGGGSPHQGTGWYSPQQAPPFPWASGPPDTGLGGRGGVALPAPPQPPTRACLPGAWNGARQPQGPSPPGPPCTNPPGRPAFQILGGPASGPRIPAPSPPHGVWAARLVCPSASVQGLYSGSSEPRQRAGGGRQHGTAAPPLDAQGISPAGERPRTPRTSWDASDAPVWACAPCCRSRP